MLTTYLPYPQIEYPELLKFTEIAAAGTAAALVPIKSITMRSRNDQFKYQGGGDEPGPVVEKLLAQLKAIQLGKVADDFGWRSAVAKAVEGEYEVEAVEGKTNGAIPGQLP